MLCGDCLQGNSDDGSQRLRVCGVSERPRQHRGNHRHYAVSSLTYLLHFCSALKRSCSLLAEDIALKTRTVKLANILAYLPWNS